ncbi:MAG: hypothetical protein GQ565_03250 [Candidatus Aegiribacteria sp.]|nr:hypothetical protein [Candidatus Aegiribacteria sp.]
MTALLVSMLLTMFFPLEKVVAVVDNSPILHSEVERLLVQMGLDPVDSYQIDSETPEYYDALEELIETRLIVNAAVGAGFYPTDDEIQVLVDEQLDLSPQGFDADIEYITEVLADNQAAQMFIFRKVQAAMQDMPLSPETYLLANPELVEEIIMPRHIGWIYLPVLPAGPDFDEVVEEMNRIRARILSGESFEELAMEYSDDGSARNGGYLGSFGPGEMTYAFEDAAFALETGEISEPVVTPFGIHIIRLDGRNEDGTIEASHILRVVPIDPADIERTVAEADSILCDIRNSLLSFEDAARVYSRDMSSSESDGDMGMIPLKLWLYEVAEAVEGLEIGSCSEPVVLESSAAVVIIRLYEDSGDIDWNSYTEAELDGLVQQVIYQDTYNSLVDSLRSEMTVIYFLENDGTSAD